MSDPARLDVAAVAEAAARLAQTREPAALVASLLDLVRAWAAPSAAFAAVRDDAVEGGWRALPGLVLGSVPLGIERSLARVAEDAPEALARGGIVQRGEEIAGVRARDNWAVPFWTGDASGALFLRGVPRPAPEGLAEALALVSATVWPRLVGSPAERVEALVAEVRAAADRLAREAQRQLDALEAQRPVATAAGEAKGAETEAPTIDERRLVALEQELRTLEGELQRLTTEAGDARAETEMLRGERDALRERLARAEEAAAESEPLRASLAKAEAAVAEAAPLAERLARAEAAVAGSQQLADRLAHAEAAAAESAALRERLARAEEAAAESEPLREKLANAEAAVAEAAPLAERLARAEAAAAESQQLADRLAHAEAAAAESAALREQLAKAEAAVAEAAPLNERLEALRRAAEAADVRSRKAEEELTAAQRDLAQARARAGQNDEERRRQLEEAEARAHAVTEQWDGARRALRAATAAVRRAAFLPPAVRVSMQEAVGPDEGEGRAAPWMGVVLLDRDAVTLEAVASALEASSVDVRIAGHPEEVALLLRTADAATLGAVVCDVMAFRSDQNVAGLIRTWDRDRPGLAYFLSFDPDNAAEAERARRIPTSLIAGHVRRPLAPPRLVETLETLAKRRGKL